MKLIIILMFFISCASVNKKPSYNATLSGYQYPFKVENFSLKSQGQSLNMAYMHVEPKSNKLKKQYVLLLHGKNFAGFYWKSVAQLFLEKGYNVIIPDQIGFGKSDKPRSYQYSFTKLALNTKKLLESLGINEVTVVGHSMGGMLATKFTKIYSQSVNKLLLINPIGLEDYLRYVEPRDTDFFYKLELEKTAQKIRNYQRKNYYDGKWSKEFESLIEFSVGQINHPDYPRVAWNSALLYGPVFNESIVHDFEHMKTPIVLILGTRDKTGPGRGFKKKGVTHILGQYDQFAKKYKKILKNGKVIPLKGLGHMPQFEDFERFKKVFIKEI